LILTLNPCFAGHRQTPARWTRTRQSPRVIELEAGRAPCRVCTRGLSGGRIAGDAHMGEFCVGSVDRWFNRARYDSDAVLTAFAAGLGGHDSIRDDPATVVRQAPEPAMSRCRSVSA